jgi:beta-N-acetylhexosaminidase
MKNKILFFLLVLSLCARAALARENPVDFDSLPVEHKLSQMIFVSTDIDKANRIKPAIEKGLIGGVLVQWGDYSLDRTKELVDKLQSWAANSPSKIPLLIAIDYEGGTVYTPVTLGLEYLPTNMALAAANDRNNTAALFYVVAKELLRLGIHINFSPVIDVNTNAFNPVIGLRSFGDDTELAGDMGVALIEGLQNGGVISVAKHFPGHGSTSTDSHLDLPSINASEETFRHVHLAPFRKAIRANVKGIMTAHVLYNFWDAKEPATFSQAIINDLLRREMSFDGLIISDSLDMAGASKNISAENAAAKAIDTGVDILLIARYPAAKMHSALMSKMEEDPALKEKVEQSAKRVLSLKKEYGLFNAQRKTNSQTNWEVFVSYASLLSQEAVTIVKSDGQTLPYRTQGDNKKICSVFFSPARFANQLTVFNIPFLQAQWTASYYNSPVKPSDKDLARIKNCMRGADLTVLGSQQWADKPNSAQVKVINALLEGNEKIILISLMNPYDIKLYPKAKNVMAIYGVNRFSVKAAADIILGNNKARGKLPVKID